MASISTSRLISHLQKNLFAAQSRPLPPSHISARGLQASSHFPTNTASHPANTPSYPANTPSYPANTPYYPVNTPIPPLRTSNPVRSNQPVSLTVYPEPTNHAISNNGPNGNGNIIPLNSANPLDNNQPFGHHYPTNNPTGASLHNVAPHSLQNHDGQPMSSDYHPNNHHLAGTPNLGVSHNAVPNHPQPHPAAPSAHATTHMPSVMARPAVASPPAARPAVIRPPRPSGQPRVCKGSRKQGVHYPCVRNPPNRVWKTKGHARTCRECLANKPSEKACRHMDALEAAGLEPCSNCYVKAARGNGGLCADCLADKEANSKLRKQGKGKGRKKGDDNVPRGGPGGGPPKGNGGGGGGSGPAPGAVGVVLSGIDQMAY
ncbi:hypothetical protein GE21DRAFT_5027 [Neurospora crassa]|uniref:Uncharacterized protein n=1 Tax=Neurospora crassa (strain ATCC 24698 / 74-OR23-1A / CBS 708.71 / DSM 1257 / FGSC 987) TaxID=367110 RepID=Q7S3J9_NEUCR|nr:hypothetical protein NCU08244 [Neurospora crassa OR74A]EAA30098.1 hypothetical protein NCU08244 [Neurospora crassa OR74A]KHE86501.1 hypothetical protein GE21DRAFT_5027 [Neurospora crassa]|eukprot:XP_959334.1 hypothetical protein NCU08244 [Neurospora crassa OR74A]